MSTKEKAIQNARYMIRKTGKPEYIYRIASAWMITPHSEKITQGNYLKKITDYQEVKLDE